MVSRRVKCISVFQNKNIKLRQFSEFFGINQMSNRNFSEFFGINQTSNRTVEIENVKRTTDKKDFVFKIEKKLSQNER